MAASKVNVLRLYKVMLRESQKFPAYNYRTYAVRRIRDAFKENKALQDNDKITEQVNKAKTNLAIIRRQAVIGKLYEMDKLIIEQL